MIDPITQGEEIAKENKKLREEIEELKKKLQVWENRELIERLVAKNEKDT